jgi:hypothetical protein
MDSKISGVSLTGASLSACTEGGAVRYRHKQHATGATHDLNNFYVPPSPHASFFTHESCLPVSYPKPPIFA